MFQALAPKVRNWLFVPTPEPRGQASEALAARLAPLCASAGQPFEVLPSLSAEALQGAVLASRAKGHKRVGFLGSFSVASAAGRTFARQARSQLMRSPFWCSQAFWPSHRRSLLFDAPAEPLSPLPSCPVTTWAK